MDASARRRHLRRRVRGGVFDAAKNQVTWTPPSPATPGTKSTQTITVIYPSPPFTAGTPITNTITGTGIPLGTTTPISQPATATGTPVAPAPAVSASKSPSGAVALGRPFTYTVSVKNTGNVGLNPVTMLDSLPAGTTFVSATSGGSYNAGAGTVAWTNPSPPLAPGATFTATVTVTYNTPPFRPGQVVTNRSVHERHSGHRRRPGNRSSVGHQHPDRAPDQRHHHQVHWLPRPPSSRSTHPCSTR